MGQYRKLWRENRKYLGAKGEPAPRKAIGGFSGAMAQTVIPQDGVTPPTVHLGPGEMKSVKKGGYQARNTLLHEWAHTQQSPETLTHPQARERGAYRLAKAISRSNPQKRNRAYNNLGDFAKFKQFGLTESPMARKVRKAL